MASNIETKIDRIAAAKEAISAAIAGKGVTVPDGTLIDGMAALIESIEAGGGGMINWEGNPYVSFTFMLSEDQSSGFTVSTPTGCKLRYNWTKDSYSRQYNPFIIIYAEDGIDSYTNGQVRFACSIPTSAEFSVYIMALSGGLSSSTYQYVYASQISGVSVNATISDTNKTFAMSGGLYLVATSNRKYVAGVTYRVVIIPTTGATNVEVF